VLAIKCLEELVFALNLLLDGFGEGGLNQNQVLLQLDALRDNVALHGLFLEAAKLLEPLGNSLLFLFLEESLTSLSNSIHELRLE
jgi:hypothetical protein